MWIRVTELIICVEELAPFVSIKQKQKLILRYVSCCRLIDITVHVILTLISSAVKLEQNQQI
jgi:hypothetical protein